MNKLSQQELWEKIQNFNFDDQNSSYPFSKKLANENNWSFSFTQTAIAEYRKFIFLCCISPTGASPSETVDKVWHLHLTYTKNYWEDFCRNTLHQDIHHHPRKGGVAEKEKHNNWYDDTLVLYEKTFGYPAPADIWPAQGTFTADINDTVYDTDFLKKIIPGFFILVFLFATAVNLYTTKGPDFLLYFSIICIAGLAATWFTQQHKKERLKQIVWAHIPSGFSVYQVTRFIHGPHRAYQTALLDLAKRGIIETNGKEYTIISLPTFLPSGENNPLLQALVQTYRNGDHFTYLEGMGITDTDDLKHPGFEKLYRLSQKVDYPKLVIPGIVLLIGFARLLQGIANNKPVGFLLMIMAVFTGITLLMLSMHSYTKAVKDNVQDFWNRQNQEGSSEDIVGNFSVLGTLALAGFSEFAFLTSDFDFYHPKNQQWTGGTYTSYSSSCSSGGDGGSSCGSGCGGGCGGCGS